MPPSESDPLVPVALPPDLAAFLRWQPGYACVTQATTEGTAYVLKTPAADLATLRGTIPVGLRHELYDHAAAPVIRTVLSLYDRPEAPLRVETFINVAEPDQRADFAALAEQEELLLLFYDEALRHRLSKRVPYPDRGDIPRILTRADELRAAIAPWRFDFERAKAAVMKSTNSNHTDIRKVSVI
ncbi:MAG TPA: hypothetical protein VKQ30_25030 [Ktedonobacterales bacterium]|nr:hypothetical protein [Ktedonobacterales bacterium]